MATKHSDVSNGTSRGEDSTEGDLDGSMSPRITTVGDVQRHMHPLQATADRLGEQVEHFAEQLDRLRGDACGVLSQISAYEKMANGTVNTLKKIHVPEREAKATKGGIRRSRNSSGRASPIAIHEDNEKAPVLQSTYEDLQNWEEERQTWRLLGLLLQAEYPTMEGISQTEWHTERFARPAKDMRIHRYSTEEEVWRSYLAEDDKAWERNVVVEWLKTSAHASGASIDSLVKQLDVDADRSTTSTYGWMYTKESIKLAKRMRTWPLPLDPSSPGLDKDLGKSSGTELITQLDPDAPTRQQRSLHGKDQSLERASWLLCWEMVRRGESWDGIRDRCEGRGEVWKALSIRGDPRANAQGTWQTRALWRRICAEAAKNGGVDAHENAVYGVMSGDLLSVSEVAQTFNDHLFAYYNSWLLQSFDLYVQTKFPDRLATNSKAHPLALVNPSSMESTLAIIKRLQGLDILKDEARNPMKMLQASLVAKRFAPFIQNIGLKLAESANQEAKSKIIVDTEEEYLEQGLIADVTLQDYDLLRVLTHIILLFQELDAEAYRSYVVENIIVAYIDFLCRAGKYQLLPIYASRLSKTRAVECMGRQLPFITAAKDRKAVMKLMKEHKMNIVQILKMQMIMIIQDTPPDSAGDSFPKLDILERGSKGSMVMPKVRRGFMTQDLTGDQKDLVHGFEWFLMLEEHWEETMTLGAVLYKYFLRKSWQLFTEVMMRFTEVFYRHEGSFRRTRTCQDGKLFRDIIDEDGNYRR
jgi:nuclear pore complex protein Nup107